MQYSQRTTISRKRWIGAVLALLFASCGGKGGSNPPVPEKVRVLLRDGDTLPGGFFVNTIESAQMALDRSIAVIASEPGSPAQNGVFSISPDGTIRSILTPANPPEGLTLTRVRNLVMARTGEFTFEVGDQLDADGVFYVSNGQLQTVARTEPGATPPGFRILGEIRIGANGLVAFTAGVSPCTVDSSTGSERIECTFKIYAGVAPDFREIVVPNRLDGQTPTAIALQVNRNREVAVGLPATGTEPIVGVIREGEFEVVLNRRQEIPGLGALLSARPRAISTDGEILIDAGMDSDGDNRRDKNRILLYEDATVLNIAESGIPAVDHAGRTVIDVRGIDVAESGTVIYQETIGEVGGATGFLSLRAWKDGVSREIAFQGLRFGRDAMDEPLRILEIEQIRVSRASGDVVFRAVIGRFDEGTRRVDRTSILRWTSEEGLEEVVQTKSLLSDGGRLTSLSIQAVNAGGDLLLIGTIDRPANRALLLVPRD